MVPITQISGTKPENPSVHIDFPIPFSPHRIIKARTSSCRMPPKTTQPLEI